MGPAAGGDPLKIADWALGGGIFTAAGSEALWFMNRSRPNVPISFRTTKPVTGTQGSISTVFIIRQACMQKMIEVIKAHEQLQLDGQQIFNPNAVPRVTL
jgi:hypothetical protein